MNFLYHVICSEFWLVLGNILIWIEPGTRGSRYCANRAEYHISRMSKKVEDRVSFEIGAEIFSRLLSFFFVSRINQSPL